jgi:hypothetical protein
VYDIRIANRCFENVAQLKYLGTATNQILIQNEIKRILNSGMVQTTGIKIRTI